MGKLNFSLVSRLIISDNIQFASANEHPIILMTPNVMFIDSTFETIKSTNQNPADAKTRHISQLVFIKCTILIVAH